MKTNETDLLMKTWMCNTLGSLRWLVVVWEQFHDCFLLKNCQWNIILRRFLRRIHQLDIVGYFTTDELPILVWDVSQKFSEKKTYLDIVSQKQISCDLSTSFVVAKLRRPLGTSSWKLLELTSVSRFLAYVTRPHEWRISVLAEKNLLWGKKICPLYTRVSR